MKEWINCASFLCLFIAMLLISYSCSHSPDQSRGPSEKNYSLHGLVDALFQATDREIYTSEECTEGLKGFYFALFKLTSEDVDLGQYTEDALTKLVEKSFHTRLRIKEKMNNLNVVSEMDEKCLDSAKNSLRALRYIEDYLIESYRLRNKNEEAPKYLEGSSPYLLKNPRFSFNGQSDLQSGDVILSRGNAYTSAAIARIGRNDMQFSHLSFVYRDESEKLKLWTTESRIEVGAMARPLAEHIKKRKARSIVFRYKDQALARKASKLIYKRVKEAQEGKGNIPYDFSMNYHDDSTLFCSEIIYSGFKAATNGKLDIPLYKTKFNKGLIPFLQTLGMDINEQNISTFKTFAPGDILYDPNFELVAEWRDPDKINDSRMKDLILTKMFEWMEEKNYRLQTKTITKAKARAAWLARRTPLVKNFVIQRLPLNMKYDLLKMFFTLENVGLHLQEVINIERSKALAPFSPKEVYQILENHRVQDFSVWAKKAKIGGQKIRTYEDIKKR